VWRASCRRAAGTPALRNSCCQSRWSARGVDRLAGQPGEDEAAVVAGLGPAGILQCHRVLSRALVVAMQRGNVRRNVATLVDAPTIQRDEVQPLSATTPRRS
jgi:threonine dehydrogenase-like Zn-dependent dehydrogenase